MGRDGIRALLGYFLYAGLEASGFGLIYPLLLSLREDYEMLNRKSKGFLKSYLLIDYLYLNMARHMPL